MNDRFKFRVWDSSANAYVPRSQFILLSDGTLIQEIGGEEVIWESTRPEFCTGLKDKNGKLIYEGDILKITDQMIDYIVKVYWENGMYCFSISPNSANLVFSDLSDNETTCEIIGNIHDDADLLELNKCNLK